jgi:ribosomal protein S18 acetylase RimI-like enzyme
MNVRPAAVEDLNVCLALDHTFVTDHVWQMKVTEAASTMGIAFQTVRLPRSMRVPYPRALEQLIEDWQRGDGFFVLEADGQVRGYIDVQAQPWQQFGWITNLAVDTGYRRRGFGSALLRQARQWAKEQHLQTLLAETTTKNYPALSFFRKLGFEFCGYNDHYYTNQDIALFFVLELR